MPVMPDGRATLGNGDTIETVRLRLVPFRPEDILGLIENPGEFESLFGSPAAPGLREFFTSGDVSAEFLSSLRNLRGPSPWHLGFAVVDREASSVVGSGGFKGPPTEGVVEIAYGIVPSHQGRGYATEVARALMSYALRESSVNLIIAHTLPANNASTKVLAKCGFFFDGEIDDPDDGLVWRWVFPVERKAENVG